MTDDINFLNSEVIVSNGIFSYLGLDGYTKEEDYLLNKINENIQENYNQFFINIKDFINIYILYILNPSSSEYYNLFNNSRADVENIQSKLFNISIYIDEQTNLINNKIQTMKNDIEQQQNSYNVLLNSLGSQKGIKHESSLMTDESVDLYKIQYIKNIILIIGVIILIIMLIKVYNK